MKNQWKIAVVAATFAAMQWTCAQEVTHVKQSTANGELEGVVSTDGLVRSFNGIPYAAPPVGPLRWKPPQPPASWSGVRKAVEFGPRCMQGRIYDDMIFRDAGPSEDCLYLNVWLPAKPVQAKLPVMVWIYGGGFKAGGSSEPRQDGGNLAKKGVVVVSMNYRLTVFGFLALPDLTKESPQHAAGNYGLMDQVAALEWVKKNIAAFGGDPHNVTIFGESAGSSSVSALIASPLAKGLFHRAIGESGACLSAEGPWKSREEAEQEGVKFTQAAFGTSSVEALRAKPAQEVLEATLKDHAGSFPHDVDGYFLPASCEAIYGEGRQSHVELLAGWNRDEGHYSGILGDDPPTVENYVARVKKEYGKDADEVLKLYPAKTDAEAKQAAADLDGSKSAGYSMWKWMELQLKTSGATVYRYEWDQALPLAKNAAPGTEATAPHAGEIEYVFEALASKDLPWRPEDQEVSELMATYWTNFAKMGNPNGPGLPQWPAYHAKDGYAVMHFSAKSAAAPDKNRARYEFFDKRAETK